jgi:nucleoside-diphosphate-sugar epimerase
MSTILITGAAGFIGSHLTAACVAGGHEVHVILRPASSARRLRPLGAALTRHYLDLRSEDDLRDCIRNTAPEIVFHLAGEPRRAKTPDFQDAVAAGEDVQCMVRLLRILSSARWPPRVFIRSGSLAEYGAAETPYSEDMREQPLTAYGAGMVAGTHFAAVLQPRLPFRIATARLALVYGPDQSTDYLIPFLIERCLDGLPSAVHRPDDRRDLIHVDDAVAGLLRLAEVELPGAAIVNLASGVAPSMRDVTKLVTEAAGASPDIVKMASEQPANGAALLLGSAERARALLGWTARTPIADGINATVAWYRACLVDEPDIPVGAERQWHHAEG